MVQGNCTPNLDQIFEQLLFRRDHFYSCCLISLFKISYYNSNNAPPFAVHSIKLIIDTTQFFPFEGGPSSVRGSHTPNLVQIFKGLVTLYAFSPFQFTIRHTTAPCLIEPVSDQTWKSPFTGGLLVVQGNCTPNLDQIFEQLLFRRDHFYSCSLISLFKISNYNSTPPPVRGPLNKIENR